ncbi:MAG: hypothetical protein QOF89_5841 [Acidobacteriota bacterium]|jgi:hypothetical protein|nr:hypothetical protein [Acidobacteriota bacterium]
MGSTTKVEYVQKTVVVTQKDKKLTLQPAAIDLKDGEWVQWNFEGLQEGEFGFISFAPPLPRLGPFYSLRSQDEKHFLGKGNKGPQDPNHPGDDYGYVALVLSAESPVALARSPEPGCDGAGNIHNVAKDVNTAPEVIVTYQDNPGLPPTLTVSPDPVGLNRGDTATWLFKGLPSDAFACFKFTPDPETHGLNPGLGPFLAFNACDGENDVAVRASGMGFAAAYPDPERWSRFTYHIELRCWDGKLLVSHDPAIDNLGSSPPQSP